MDSTKPQLNMSQPPPAPVDLDGLAAELEANGWEIAYPLPELVRLYRVVPVDATTDRIYRVVADEYCISAGERDMPQGSYRPKWDASAFNSIQVTDPVWQRALEIIARHTQPTEGAK